MAEFSLAELIPLWRTLREGDVTALVTPALDYVGALELGGLDVRFASDEALAGAGEALRSFVGGLDDACNLLFLSRVYEEDEATIQAYRAATSSAQPAALREYIASRAAWLRAQRVRRARLFLFFSAGGTSRSPLERGHLGMKLLFQKLSRVTEETHHKRLKELAALRDRLSTRLLQLGLPSRELMPVEVRRLYYELLNPGRARVREDAPSAPLVDNLWSDAFVNKARSHLREYTEAEQLCFEDIEDGRGHFRQGGLLRRVATLKVLPEAGTDYFSSQPLQSLSTRTRDGALVPFGYTLAVSINVEPQAFTRWRLNTQHKLVDALRQAVPFLADRSIGKEVEDAAKQQSITQLFMELNEMATKVVTLSVSLLLDADSLESLDERTEAAKAAFARAGNSELMVEDVAQLPAFLSMLPGSGPYQLRKKGCTSRNAADFLPLYTPWCGGEAASVMPTPTGEFFRFALFDKSFGVNAFHGLVAADTGSGKSFTMGAFMLDGLAAGLDGILVDNGNSWKQLTELMGGIHIPVDLNTSISPFLSYRYMLDADGNLDTESIRQVVRFIEVCVTDIKLPSFDLLQQDVVGRAVTRCYKERFRQSPEERPLLGDFRAFLHEIAQQRDAHPKDKEVAADIHLRLRMFCDEDGVYSKFLNRPSNLRFDSRLLTFELEKVSKDPLTRKIAMAAIMEALGNRAATRRRKTLVAVDEAHEYLGNDPSVESFLAGCYAKMRKYDVAMWTISQKFETFMNCRVAPTIIGNSALKLFLWHSSGHGVVGRYFNLSPRALSEFSRLEKRAGRHSDVFLMYGTHMATVRVAMHPLAYWILTTDGDDKALLERTVARNPSMSRLEILRELAARYPEGAPRGARHRAA